MTRAVYGSIVTDSKHSSFVIGHFRKGLYTPGLPHKHRVTERRLDFITKNLNSVLILLMIRCFVLTNTTDGYVDL